MRTAIVVDDEPITRMDISQMLGELGFNVVGDAADGFDAVELCKVKNPDVVLLDIKMPVFDGFHAAEIIIREKIAGCVLFLTAFCDKDLLTQANQIGITGYLTKPIEQRLLLPAIEVAISQSKRLKEAKTEIETVKRKLEDNRLIERAKAILAKEKGIMEAEAYRELQKLAMNKRCSIAAIAEAVVMNKSEREVINRAKRILMEQEGICESTAYRMVITKAKEKKISNIAFAQEIISRGDRI